MRCRECNVDLPETYAVCPLCGKAASNDPPVLEGIRTAEYPRVKTEPYKRNPFPVFVGIWLGLSVLSLAMSALDIISQAVAAAVICAVPCIWTLIFRPLLVKQLYAGNFIMMNLLPFALTSIVFSYLNYGSILPALMGYLPVCCITVLVALTILILAKPKKSKRAASYPMLTGASGILAGIATACASDSVPFLWIAVTVLCICILALLFFINPQATKEELKAKFSIQ